MAGQFYNHRKQIHLKNRLLTVAAVLTLLLGLILNIVLIFGQSGASSLSGDRNKPEEPISAADPYSAGVIMVLAPNQTLDTGSQLSAENLKLIPWPRANVPVGAVRRIEEIEGYYSRVPLTPGIPVVRSLLSEEGLSGGIADLLRNGMRASTIRVDETTGVESWTQPGSHVDVLVTYFDKHDGQEKAQIEVEDAVVLSYNRSVKADQNAVQLTRPGGTATVTLATPVAEAVRLGLIQSMGKISLMLRPLGEKRSIKQIVVTGEDIRRMGGADRKKEKKKPTAIARFQDFSGVRHSLELSENEWIEDGRPAN